MRLKRARVRGFQPFGDSGEVEFAEGINLIIGQNNAGKSALLRALLPQLPDDRHRTPEKWESFRLPRPEITLTIDVSGNEVRDWLLRSNGTHYIPTPTGGQEWAVTFMNEFFGLSSVLIPVGRTAGSNFNSESYPSHQLFPDVPGKQRFATVVKSNDGELTISSAVTPNDSLPGLAWPAWGRDMFYFAAERMTIGEAAPGRADRLLPNAGNLPNVLHTLSGERGDVFTRLVGHLGDIFATVGNLSVRTKSAGGHPLEVRVWPTEAMEQVELSFPLNSSGTGVAQVTAILAAVMTIDNAIIIIDEINSFLHPAAVKALLRIIQTRYSQHQYIISTHSPEVISFSNPKTIHLVKRAGYESSVKRLDLAKVGELRDVAQHLGVSMTDVFAADRVIWVEGPTEELCFPYLYEQLVGALPRGVAFTSVVATGDFTRRRDREIVYEVYHRLCAATAALVVSVVFSFDTEKLTDAEKQEMQRDAGGSLRFLPRRHLECYLVDPAAIAALIVSKDSASAGTVTQARVEDALREAAAERPFWVSEWSDDISDEGWLARVDAAGLIAAICETLSGQRVPFEKKRDSLFLLRHVVEHSPERLAPLTDYVKDLVAAVATGEVAAS